MRRADALSTRARAGHPATAAQLGSFARDLHDGMRAEIRSGPRLCRNGSNPAVLIAII
jgi:hypothetical protein